MKKVITLVLALALCGSAVLGCSTAKTTDTTAASATKAETAAASSTAAATTAAAGPTSITVVTSYGVSDGNRANYEAAVAAYESATGNTVNDASGTSNEEWKAKIMADFETGAEPDVLFYFNGVDANDLVTNGKVVSIDTIREVYPEYASNMKDEMIPASPADGVKYAVP
jgi:raffinose/stachyose/melibiose transport system substrate-binding protein